MQTDFEAMGGTYTQAGDYLLPKVGAPERPKIGIFAVVNICRRYRKSNFRNKTNFRFFPLFPPLNIHTNFVDGQTMPTERKTLSSERVFFRRKRKGENEYEQQ